MKVFAKWTGFSMFAVTSVGAALAFGGCTVTSGTVDDDGGTVRDRDSGSSNDSGDGDAANPDSGVVTCQGNDRQTFDLGAGCQACLNARCCSELKTCFNADPGNAALSDCNKHAECVVFCNNDQAGNVDECEEECRAATTPAIADAYDGVLACAVDQNCGTVCGIAAPDGGS